jgi:hypothetical protein
VNTAEELVLSELAKCNLRGERFSKSDMRDRKTPDYQVYKDNAFAFFCEVKEIKKDNWANGVRSDPIFNRLTDDIHKAVKQFNSVNASLEHPNVLAFVNNDEQCGFLDLLGVLSGRLMLENGGSAPLYLKYSGGRIKIEKDLIHFYLWFDAFKPQKILFNTIDTRHFDKLCNFFNIDRKDIKMITV